MVLFTSIFSTIGNANLSNQTCDNQKNQNILNNTCNSDVCKIIENLLTVRSFVLSKKSDLIISKKSNLSKNFIKTYFYKMHFLGFKAKKVFVYLQKAFSKLIILHYFWQKYYIRIESKFLVLLLVKFTVSQC